MKKTVSLILSLLVLAALFVPVSAVPDMPGLIITEILRNPLGNDTYEGFEIMNASDAAIDLYDYRIFYRKGVSVEENAAVAASDVTLYTYLAAEPGTVVLAPGEIAMVWCVYSDCYKKSDAQYGAFVKDLGNGSIEYNFDAYRNDMKTDSGKELDPSVKVLVNDKTGGKYFETKVAAAEHGFNLENSGIVRMWVCPREGDITSATCIIDSLTAGKGVPTSYEPVSGSVVMAATDSEDFTPGTLDAKQTSLKALVEYLASPVTEAPATTAAPESTETPATEAPATEAPVTTDGKSPETGDNALILVAALLLVSAVLCTVLCTVLRTVSVSVFLPKKKRI